MKKNCNVFRVTDSIKVEKINYEFFTKMNSEKAKEIADTDTISDEEIVRRVCGGEIDFFEVLMRRYNQRLYRTARAITGDAAEAEDVMQDAYVRAFTHLKQFEGRAKFSTWLTRIAANEAAARVRRNRRFMEIDAEKNEADMISTMPDAEQNLLKQTVGKMLEAAIDQLPPNYRSVFMLRAVEGMTALETAESLDISDETVRVRLHRARAFLRKAIYAQTGAATAEAFRFAGSRCDGIVMKVFERLDKLKSAQP